MIGRRINYPKNFNPFFKDSEGIRIHTGFYYDLFLEEPIYFTGEYSGMGLPLFDSKKGEIKLTPNRISGLVIIRNPKDLLNNKKANIDWMEKKLSELEEKSLS